MSDNTKSHYTNGSDPAREGRLHEAEHLAAIDRYLNSLRPDRPTGRRSTARPARRPRPRGPRRSHHLML